MRAVVAAALRCLEHPVLAPLDDGSLSEDELEDLLDEFDERIDDQVTALAFLLERFLPRWKLARVHAHTRRT